VKEHNQRVYLERKDHEHKGVKAYKDHCSEAVTVRMRMDARLFRESSSKPQSVFNRSRQSLESKPARKQED